MLFSGLSNTFVFHVLELCQGADPSKGSGQTEFCKFCQD
jgi:hypothetical protein